LVAEKKVDDYFDVAISVRLAFIPSNLAIDNKCLFQILIGNSALLEAQFHTKTKIKREKSDEKNIFGLINHIICICLQQRLDQKASARM